VFTGLEFETFYKLSKFLIHENNITHLGCNHEALVKIFDIRSDLVGMVQRDDDINACMVRAAAAGNTAQVKFGRHAFEIADDPSALLEQMVYVRGRQRVARNSDRPRASSCPASRPYVPVTEETKAKLCQDLRDFAAQMMVQYDHDVPVKKYGTDYHAFDVFKAAYCFDARRHVNSVLVEKASMLRDHMRYSLNWDVSEGLIISVLFTELRSFSGGRIPFRPIEAADKAAMIEENKDPRSKSEPNKKSETKMEKLLRISKEQVEHALRPSSFRTHPLGASNSMHDKHRKKDAIVQQNEDLKSRLIIERISY
jgi:hypothetical protein